MKSFNVPQFYRSPLISRVKQFLKLQDPRKKSARPAVLDFGNTTFYIARHFGFCYGVENAIEIAFRALAENPGKRIFLLSQMIHNPEVNKDLLDRGVRFIQDTLGNPLIPFDSLNDQDTVIIPAFGAPLELLKRLEEKGITAEKYNTTCPFVERVWKKSEQIGRNDFTIIIHGKYNHEETRATFSRSAVHSQAVVVVRDLEEAHILAKYLRGEGSQSQFEQDFMERHSPGFDIQKHLHRVGVINQTTMLASETAAIAAFFRDEMQKKYGVDELGAHFADTHDTLCYATNENQDATYGLLETDADIALVIGGYNSSNTSHLAELCEQRFPTYFISSAAEIRDDGSLQHFDYPNKRTLVSDKVLLRKEKLKIVVTSGASCPDSVLEDVIHRINTLRGTGRAVESVLESITVYNPQHAA